MKDFYNDNETNEDNETPNKKTKLPIIFWILRVAAVGLIIAGIVMLIKASNIHVPEMGEDGWFDANKNKNHTKFTGTGLISGGVFLFFASLIPSFLKLGIKTRKYIINQNKETLKETMEDLSDLGIHDMIKNANGTAHENAANEEIECPYCGNYNARKKRKCASCGAIVPKKKKN